MAVDLSGYADLVARDLPQPEQHNYEVTGDTIRHFAYAIPDYNALYLDPAYAQSTRWQGIIAPPGYLYSHGYSSWLRMFPGLRDSEGRELAQNDNAGEEWEFILPVRPGDTIRSQGRVLSVTAKNGRRLGECALIETEMRYLNQRGALVARAVGRSFRFNAKKIAGEGGMAKSYPAFAPGQTTRNVYVPLEMPGTVPTPAREHRQQRFFEDVVEGEELPPWELGPLNTALLGRFDAAVFGRSADQVGALQGGAIPDAFAPGPLRIPWFGSLLTRWAGPDGWVSRLSQQNREWVLVGFKIICRGTVIRKSIDGARHLVDIDLRCDSELGFTTNIGRAQVELPRRPAR